MSKFRPIYAMLLFLLAAAGPGVASADCSLGGSGTRKAGTIVYNNDYDVMLACIPTQRIYGFRLAMSGPARRAAKHPRRAMCARTAASMRDCRRTGMCRCTRRRRRRRRKSWNGGRAVDRHDHGQIIHIRGGNEHGIYNGADRGLPAQAVQAGSHCAN